MLKEVTSLGNSNPSGRTWEESNVLAGGIGALEELWGLYRDVALGSGTPSGAYEVTSLTRP